MKQQREIFKYALVLYVCFVFVVFSTTLQRSALFLVFTKFVLFYTMKVFYKGRGYEPCISIVFSRCTDIHNKY